VCLSCYNLRPDFNKSNYSGFRELPGRFVIKKGEFFLIYIYIFFFFVGSQVQVAKLQMPTCYWLSLHSESFLFFPYLAKNYKLNLEKIYNKLKISVQVQKNALKNIPKVPKNPPCAFQDGR